MDIPERAQASNNRISINTASLGRLALKLLIGRSLFFITAGFHLGTTQLCGPCKDRLFYNNSISSKVYLQSFTLIKITL